MVNMSLQPSKKDMNIIDRPYHQMISSKLDLMDVTWRVMRTNSLSRVLPSINRRYSLSENRWKQIGAMSVGFVPMFLLTAL